MSVVLDIARAYRAPVTVFRRRLGGAPREDRALVTLMLACGLIFVSQLPVRQCEAFETGGDFQMLAGATLFAWLFVMPLLAYGFGSLTHATARLFGGRGTGYGARFALFWGLTRGFVGPGLEERAVGLVALLAFLVHWSLNLWAAERGPK